jgi:hypothetical protein
MKKIRQNGFVSVLAITAIALIGVEILVLTAGSNAILFQSNAAYLDAFECNLVASGLAWVEHNVKNENIKSFNETVELNTADMKIRKSTLSVTIARPADKQAEVQINASYGWGRQILKLNDKYQIEL